MKHELFCDAVRDLLPLYAEGLTSPETAEAIREHLDGCEPCRQAQAAADREVAESQIRAREIDYLKKIRCRSKRKVWVSVLAVFLAVVAALSLWIHFGYVLHVKDVAFSPDRTRAVVVYDTDITGGSGDKPVVYLRLFDNLKATAFTDFSLRWFGAVRTENTSSILYSPPYDSILWSPDSSMFVVNHGRVDLVDLEGIHSSNVYDAVKTAFQDSTVKQLGYAVSENGDTLKLSAVQWNESGTQIQFSYALTDGEGESHTGYFWYTLLNGFIHDIEDTRIQYSGD